MAPGLVPRAAGAVQPVADAPAGDRVSPPARAARRWRGVGAGLLVGGVVLSAAGIALLAVDGHYGRDCWSPGDPTTCPVLYQTAPAGGAALGVGVAALASATVLLVLDARRPPRRERR